MFDGWNDKNKYEYFFCNGFTETYKKFNICIPLVAAERCSSIALFLLELLDMEDVLGALILPFPTSSTFKHSIARLIWLQSASDIRFCTNFFFSTSFKLQNKNLRANILNHVADFFES